MRILFRCWMAVSVAILISVFSAEAKTPAKTTSASACAAPVYRQFDFWLGDWDTFESDKPNSPVARNHVTRILSGCVLLEDYSRTGGLHGQSFTIYDASRGVWHQTWVTNEGELLVIEGGFHDGQMVLSGVQHMAGGKERQVRGVWKPVADGVRETATTSLDGGTTWEPWFDLVFRRHKE
jgi:hypothetical protein